MITHEKLYYAIGIRKTEDFVDPKTLLESEFVFPYNSNLIYHSVKDLGTGPNAKQSIFKNVKAKKAYVFTRTEYINHIGRVTERKDKIRMKFKELKKASPEFKWVAPGKTATIHKEELVINNYGLLPLGYRYGSDRLAPYYKWYNSFNTIFEDLAAKLPTSNRIVYITIDVPTSLPKHNIFEQHLKEPNSKTVEIFNTPEHLAILEFFKLLTPKYMETSIMHKIKIGLLPKINFIFRYNDKMVLLNMQNLMSMVKEYNISTRMYEVSYATARKLFLLMLMKLRKSAPLIMSEAEKKETVVSPSGVTDKKINVDIETIEANLDTQLEEESDEDKVLTKIAEDAMDEDTIENTMDDEETITTLDEFNKGLGEHEETYKKTKRLFDGGLITKREYENTLKLLDEQKEKTSPFPGDDRKIKEMLNVTNDEITIKDDETIIPDNVVVKDKTLLKDTLGPARRKYIKETYPKHIVSTFLATQNEGVVIKAHDIRMEESVLGEVEYHTIEFKPLDGKPSKQVVVLPKISEEGTYMMSGHKYTLRTQRADVPIRKINANQVSLSSYYGKAFITRSDIKNNDMGYWFMKQLITKTVEGTDFKNVVTLSVDIMDQTIPKDYTMVSRFVKSFIYKDVMYVFDYNKRKTYIKETSLKEVEGNKYIFIAQDKNSFILMDKKNGTLFRKTGNNYENLGNITEYFGFDISTAPVEFSTLKVFKTRIGIGVVLAYLLGFKNILKLFKIKHIYIPLNEGVNIRRHTMPYEYAVRFSDGMYVFNRNDKLHAMLMGSFFDLNKLLRDVSESTVNNKTSFVALFNLMNVNSITMQELNLMDNMFVDPMTKKVLELMNEPLTFKGLLYRSCELLMDDNYKNPNNMFGTMLKGYERIPGLVYRTMIDSLRTYKNKSLYSKQQVVIDPYEVWRKIGDDSTSLLMDDLNPIIELKQQEDVTFLGAGGRSRETMVAKTRVFHPSEAGFISEATKDSADVGITASLPAVPLLENTIGYIDEKKRDIGVANAFSTSLLLAPDARKDDPKRRNFISIQNSHTVPTLSMTVPYVRTSYASVIPYRVSKKYAYHAEEDGVVVKATPSKLTIRYKSGKGLTLNLGIWRGKEESGISYEHENVTMLTTGDSFKKGANITHDKAFFEPDIFDKTKIVYKTGTMIRTAMLEDPMTHEDSSVMSKSFTEKMKVQVAKVKSYIVDVQDEILNIIEVGTKVKPDVMFFTTSTGTIGDLELFDTKSLEIIQSLKNKSPKSDMYGEVVDIKVFYNSGYEDMSPTFKAFVDERDKLMARKEGNPKFIGKVNSSYSVNGKPLVPGKAEIKIYIRDIIGMGIADKSVMGGQLKTTVGEILDYNITSEDGREIEYLFSTRAVNARIVESVYTVGTASTLLREVGKNIAREFLE